MKIDATLIISILAIIIPLIVTYHLAKKQGIFKSVDLRFFPVEADFASKYLKFQKRPWFIVHSSEAFPSEDETILVYLPLTIFNKGKVAAENVTFALEYDSAYSTTYLGDDVMYGEAKHMNQIRRSHQDTPFGTSTFYEFPIIPAQSGVPFFEVLPFRSRELKYTKTEMEKWLFKNISNKTTGIIKMRYHISAKNISKSIQGEFFVFLTKQKNIKDFVNANTDVIMKLLEKFDYPYVKLRQSRLWIPWPYQFFFKLLYSRKWPTYKLQFKSVNAFSMIEDDGKKLHVIEAIEESQTTWSIIKIPLSVKG
jgi:hypothetical protein